MINKIVGLCVCMLLVGMLGVGCSSGHETIEESGTKEQSTTRKKEDWVIKVKGSQEEDNILVLPEDILAKDNYFKIEDIRADQVDEMAFYGAATFSYYDSIVRATDDGFLHIYLPSSIRRFEEKQANQQYVMRRADKEGHILWEKRLESTISKVHALERLEDGGILVAASLEVNDKYLLLHYCKDGELIWKTDLSDLSYDYIADICVTEERKLLIVGDREGLGESGGILITTINEEGKVTSHSRFSTRDFQEVREAKYIEGTGLILKGHNFGVSYVALLNNKLELQWIKDIWEKEKCLITEQGIYVLTEDSGQLAVIGLNELGESIKELVIPIKAKWWDKNAILKDGSMVLTIYEGSWRDIKQTYSIIQVDQELEGYNIVDEINMRPDDMMALDDGGLMIQSLRNVKEVSAPIVISSIWYDTETVMCKYNEQLDIDWRKTYNQFEDERRDLVYPMPWGKVLNIPKDHVFDLPYNWFMTVRAEGITIPPFKVNNYQDLDTSVEYFKNSFQNGGENIPYLKPGTKVFLDFLTFPPKHIRGRDYILKDDGSIRYTKEIIGDVPLIKENGDYYFEVTKHMGSLLSSYYEEGKKDYRGIAIIIDQGGEEYAYTFVFKTDG